MIENEYEEYPEEVIIKIRERKPFTKPNFKGENFKIYEGDGFDSEFESYCSTRLDVFLENIESSKYTLKRQVKYFQNKRFSCDFVLEYNGIKYWIEVSTYNLNSNESYQKKIELKRTFVNGFGNNNKFIFINSKREMNEFIKSFK